MGGSPSRGPLCALSLVICLTYNLVMRHRQRRILRHAFSDRYFKPRGVSLRDLDEVTLSYEELEALRLRYLENMRQSNAAKQMGISQSQYQRDLWASHRKITEALIEGKSIRIFSE